jgi:hypothetical protein
MINDNDVALMRLLMHQSNEATLELGTLLTGAEVAARVDLGPRSARLRQGFDLRTVAGLGGFFPFADDLEVGDLFQPCKHRLLFAS